MAKQKNNIKDILSNWISGVLAEEDSGEVPSSVDLQSLEERVLYSAGPVPMDLAPSVEVVELGETDTNYFDSIETNFDSLEESLDAYENDYLFGVQDNGSLELTLGESVSTELVIVDQTVEGYEILVDDLLSQQSANRQFEIVYLAPNQDGVQQISEALSQRSGLNAIHLVSHGSDGELRLGNSTLSSDNLDSYSSEIANWRNALADNADILIYGCDVACLLYTSPSPRDS